MTSAAKLLLIGLGCGLLADCRRETATPGPSVKGSTMGTYYRVTMADVPKDFSGDSLQTELDRIDALMSTYKADSEVSRFNRSESTDWFPVSSDTATVVTAALEIFEASDGAFDITVGPLVDLWGFGPQGPVDKIPNDAEIEALLATLGSHHLHVRHDPPALKKDHPDIRIDLSAIAKGYAVDALATLLREKGITDYLVDIGGEMRAGGMKTEQNPWMVAIETPTPGKRGVQTTLPLLDVAIATSGDYRNYFEDGSQRFSHEIDPRNGRPIQHSLVSASVIDRSCMRADAWATALMILGPDDAKALVAKAGLSAYLMVKDGSGFRELSTPIFTPQHR